MNEKNVKLRKNQFYFTTNTVVAAMNDTADDGGSSINSGSALYWSMQEYDGSGNIVYDTGWSDSKGTWTVGISGNGSYPYGGNSGIRQNSVKYVVPIFRINDGNTSSGSGWGERLGGDDITAMFPIFYLVTSPFTYTFECNGGKTVNNETRYTKERLGIATPTWNVTEPTREGYNFTGWKITSSTGKQTGRVYTTSQLNSMFRDGKYWSSLFCNATFEAQWSIKGNSVYFDANGGTFNTKEVCNG